MEQAGKTPTGHPGPAPAAIFETLTAYQRASALKAAIDLDLFSAVAGGATTVDDLAKRVDAAPRGVRALADFLVTLGFLVRDGERYRLSDDAALFLDRKSPAYLGGVTAFLNSPYLTRAFDDAAAAVRQGGTTVEKRGSLAPEHPMWVQFARGMAQVAAVNARILAEILEAEGPVRGRILDVAAGHGMYGITLARRNSAVELTALDWPPVLAVAEEHARAAGVEGRLRLLRGDAFTTPLDGPYDLILLTNFLHHFDVPTCEAFLARVHQSLAPGGRAVTVEFVPDEDRLSPPEAVRFRFVMLMTTPAGDAYTFPELDAMFRRAGFASNTLHPLGPTPHRVVISRA